MDIDPLEFSDAPVDTRPKPRELILSVLNKELATICDETVD